MYTFISIIFECVEDQKLFSISISQLTYLLSCIEKRRMINWTLEILQVHIFLE